MFELFERYSYEARSVIFSARYQASQFDSGTIEPEHLLLGLMPNIPGQTSSVAGEDILPFIQSRGQTSWEQVSRLIGKEIPWAELRPLLENKLGPASPELPTSLDMPLSDPAQQVLEHSLEECDQFGGGTVEIGHLLLGLLREEGSYPAALLRERGADPAAIRARLTEAE